VASGGNDADWRAGFASPDATANRRSRAGWFDNLAVAGSRIEDTLGPAGVPWGPASPGIGTPPPAESIGQLHPASV